MTDLKVVMMGLGYIGLPTAALIASRGIKVREAIHRIRCAEASRIQCAGASA